jgi:putative Mg2+ transporter-C (MgtC) family protein
MLTQSDLVILARAVLAAGLGFLIGWERQVTGSPIKARTIGLAALTAASLTALGHEIFATGTDRVVQGIITGIGFLGAGVIMRGASGADGPSWRQCCWRIRGLCRVYRMARPL